MLLAALKRSQAHGKVLDPLLVLNQFQLLEAKASYDQEKQFTFLNQGHQGFKDISKGLVPLYGS